MLIGIILGFVLGIVLLLIGFIGIIITKQKNKSKPWPVWLIVAGGCAVLTAIFNIM